MTRHLENLAELAAAKNPYMDAIEEVGAAMTEHLTGTAMDGLAKISGRLDALLFKSDAILHKWGPDEEFGRKWREAASSTRASDGADALANSSGGHSPDTGFDDNVSRREFQTLEELLSDDDDDDDLCEEESGYAAVVPGHRGATAPTDHVEGLRVKVPAPPAAPPPDSYWLPAAIGLVAPGSRVYILRGAFKGRCATVLAAGDATGLMDGCSLRLDGALPGSEGWCLGKSLTEVGAQPKNERIRLPADLGSFRPDRKRGPERRLFSSDAEISLQLLQFGDVAAGSRDVRLVMFDDDVRSSPIQRSGRAGRGRASGRGRGRASHGAPRKTFGHSHPGIVSKSSLDSLEGTLNEQARSCRAAYKRK